MKTHFSKCGLIIVDNKHKDLIGSLSLNCSSFENIKFCSELLQIGTPELFKGITEVKYKKISNTNSAYWFF